MSEVKRTDWIDTARAIAMLLVITGHICAKIASSNVYSVFLLEDIQPLFNPIKLPLFFAISGYLFSSKNDNPHYFFSKLFRSRIVPYIVWGSFMGVVAFTMDFLRSGLNRTLILPLFLDNYIYPFFLGNLVWYVPCLTLVEVLFFLLLKISHKRTLPLIVLVSFCTMAGYILSADHIVKPWKFDTALTCIQFVAFGYLLRSKFSDGVSFLFSKKSLVLSTFTYIFVFFSSFLIFHDCSVDVNQGIYFNFLGFSLLAFSGIIAIFSICRALPSFPFILFIGRNTLIYFIWHMYAVHLIVWLFRFIIPSIFNYPSLLAIMVLLSSCVVVSIVCKIVNRYFGFTVGKKRTSSFIH